MALKITRPEKIVSLCTDAALQAEWELAQDELHNASRGVQDGRLNGGGQSKQAQAVQDVEQRMVESMVRFRLRARGRNEWAALVAEHAPRPDNADDKARGVNTETF